MSGEPDPLYVRARAALLDTLDALEPHLDALDALEPHLDALDALEPHLDALVLVEPRWATLYSTIQ